MKGQNIGVLEITAVVAIVVVVTLLHLSVILLSYLQRRKSPRWELGMYGIPDCYLMGSLLTPPDFISAVIVGGGFAFVYVIVVSALIVLRRRLRLR